MFLVVSLTKKKIRNHITQMSTMHNKTYQRVLTIRRKSEDLLTSTND